ncbi:hypothetical protein IW146_007300 [Coemansia sp. RSA 922]|nr:hypothetical protein H4S04_006715 [Coemansia sp. S16]KAJ2059537.1 hypothetical protein GGI08_003218 [Coemansia sp. S2]KAJ2107467.1 hypothetical protein IW146_007300 [Coemansia sp. RSA 922]KAJ2428668.1 hypothetical protein GGF41_001308 [Coemansia sp. RSA 2531]
MDCAVEQGSCVSLEQVRAAFKCNSPWAVSNAVVPFLQEEARSTGDIRVINEIAKSIGQLVYSWFQRSEAMNYDDKYAMYSLLRPDKVLMKTLRQYNTLQRQRVGGGDGLLSIGMESLPSEWHGRAAVAAAYLRAHAPKSVRVVEDAGSVELRVGALQYVLYHMCRALVPSADIGVRQGTLVEKSVVNSLSHDLIHFFLPVADVSISDAEHAPREQSPRRRSLLLGTQHGSGQRTAPVSTDLLDICEQAQAIELAEYFAFCAGLAWLPGGADLATWEPSLGHVAGLNLFHGVIHYMSKGERQLEQTKAGGPKRARMEMNATVRKAVRRRLTGPLINALALVLAAGKRPGVVDSSEMWLPFFAQAVRTWARYAMPWYNLGTEVLPIATELSEVWKLRMKLVVWEVGAPMYAPVLADIVQLLAAPHVDLLARAPRSAIDDATALSSLCGVDALKAVECIAAAFAEPELRAILVAIDRLRGRAHVSTISPRFDALIADATRVLASESAPPTMADSTLFVSPRSPLLKDLVVALQRADSLCDRQLSLLETPSFSSVEWARFVIVDFVTGLLSANTPVDPHSTVESAHTRSNLLRDDKNRISRVRPKLAAVFQATPADIDVIKQESAPFVLAGRPPAAARRIANEMGSAATPEMNRGLLTPQGRSELKTGRRKFTTMSLVATPSTTPGIRMVMHDEEVLRPRGPRAVYIARSYEIQWLLDLALRFKGVANRYYQRGLDLIEKCIYPIPIPELLRTADLDFRWVAAYQNLNFMALVLFLFMLVRWLFF